MWIDLAYIPLNSAVEAGQSSYSQDCVAMCQLRYIRANRGFSQETSNGYKVARENQKLRIEEENEYVASDCAVLNRSSKYEMCRRIANETQPEPESNRKKLRRRIGEAFGSVPKSADTREEERQSDTASRVKTVKAELHLWRCHSTFEMTRYHGSLITQMAARLL